MLMEPLPEKRRGHSYVRGNGEIRMASDKVLHVTDGDFEEQVIKGKGLILVDFWA